MQITQEVQKMQLVFGGSLEACTLTRILSCTVQDINENFYMKGKLALSLGY